MDGSYNDGSDAEIFLAVVIIQQALARERHARFIDALLLGNY